MLSRLHIAGEVWEGARDGSGEGDMDQHKGGQAMGWEGKKEA